MAPPEEAGTTDVASAGVGRFARLVAFDRAALRSLAARRRRPVVAALWVFTWSGASVTWIALSAGLFVWAALSRTDRTAAAGLLAAAAASGAMALLGTALKQLVRRPRPWTVMPDLRPVARPHERWSFPSSHAATSAAFAAVLVATGHALAPLAVAWSAIVAFSRLVLSLHYPSDVCAGALLGATMGLAFGRFAWAPLTAWLVEVASVTGSLLG